MLVSSVFFNFSMSATKTNLISTFSNNNNNKTWILGKQRILLSLFLLRQPKISSRFYSLDPISIFCSISNFESFEITNKQLSRTKKSHFCFLSSYTTKYSCKFGFTATKKKDETKKERKKLIIN